MDVDTSLLSWVIFLPLGVAVVLMVADGLLQLFVRSSLSEQIWKLVALGASLVGFALSVAIWVRFDPTAAGVQMVERASWGSGVEPVLRGRWALAGAAASGAHCLISSSRNSQDDGLAPMAFPASVISS